VTTDLAPDLAAFRRFFLEDFEAAAAEIEATERIPDALLERTAQLGAYRLTPPTELGGYAMTASEYLPYLEVSAMGPGAGRMLVHVNNGIWRPLIQFGNAAQKQIAKQLTAGEVCVAFALTERAGGTGRDIHSHARRTDGGWLVTGEKHLITFADRADHFILVVATDGRQAKDSLTAFLVPRNTAGFKIDATQRTMGIHGTGHAWLRYHDMELSDDIRLGEVGQGLEVALSFLDYSRLSLSTCMVGLGQRALDEAVAFAKHRKTFGKLIAERQAIQAHIADMQADLLAGRALVRTVAAAYDAGEDITAIASAAKLYCLNMVGRVTDHSLRVHGGYGFTKEAPIERIYRDARGFWFEEGTQEIQQLVVARDVLEAHRD